jgi:Tol biopolymer transport system component
MAAIACNLPTPRCKRLSHIGHRNGRQIVFSAAAPGKPFRLLLISADGGSPQPINPVEEDETDPTWSSDGGTIAFGHHTGQVATTYIGLFDLKSRQITRLPGSEGLFGPRLD